MKLSAPSTTILKGYLGPLATTRPACWAKRTIWGPMALPDPVLATRLTLADGINLRRHANWSAYYIGYVGHGNLGDEALYQAIAQEFAKHVSLYAGLDDGLLARACRPRDVHAIVLGGGTLIKAPSIQLQRIRVLRERYPNAKFVVFGTGVGDVKMWESFGISTNTEVWRAILDEVDYLTVRGPLSKGFLEDWGVKQPINVVGDPALLLARDRVKPKLRRRKIGLNLGPARSWIHGRNEREVLAIGADLLRCLKQSGWQITLFPVVRDDIQYLRDVVKFAGIGPLPMHTAFLDVHATLRALEQQDVFIGEKLHSVVLASCVYTPAIMLEYNTKCRDFMLSIDRDRWNFRTDALDVVTIKEGVDELYEDIGQHQAQLFAQVTSSKSKIQSAAREVIAIIGGERSCEG